MTQEELGMTLDYDAFFDIIHHMHDEIWVYDHNFTIVYVNEAVRGHYGMEPQDLIGKNFFDLVADDMWTPSILPHVYEGKRVYAIKQTTNLGIQLVNIAKPILDEHEDIKFVAMSVREELDQSIFINGDCWERSAGDVSERSIVCQHKSMQTVMKMAKKISKINATCLIVGEAGTGKTTLAQFIHNTGNRHDQPFLSLNCAAIPPEMIDAELFGYTKSTGVDSVASEKIGLLERANGGTILLDEVSLLPLHVQSKLLQVLQEKSFVPMGATQRKTIDVKVIVTTKEDLPERIKGNLFREDLYYRLNIFEINMPPLRKRGEDLDLLILHFLEQCTQEYQLKRTISEETMLILKQYTWPGNVQELHHTIERLVVTTDEDVIEPLLLPAHFLKAQRNTTIRSRSLAEIQSFDDAVESYKKELIQSAYDTYKTTRKMAEAMGVSQAKISTLMRKYQIV